MHVKSAILATSLILLPFGSAQANKAISQLLYSGSTTASTYLTFKDHKLVVAAQDDAGSYVASEGAIRGPYLEAAMHKVRADNPGLNVSDMELANAILAKNAVASE